jgi:hypothetical protein
MGPRRHPDVINESPDKSSDTASLDSEETYERDTRSLEDRLQNGIATKEE